MIKTDLLTCHQASLIRSTRNSLSIPALLRTSSFLTLSIRANPTKLLKLFITRTFTFLHSALLIIHASAPYNGVGTIAPSYRHFFAFIPNPLFFSAPQALYSSLIVHHIRFTTSIRCHLRPQILKTSSNGSLFSLGKKV